MNFIIDGEYIIEKKDNVYGNNQYVDDGIEEIKQSSELGEALRELNDDSIDKNGRHSGIDMRSNLHPIEISSILAVDTLVNLRFLPKTCLDFTRQKKRLAVSKLGQGRKDTVTLVSGQREHQQNSGNGGIVGGIKNMFGGRKNEI